MKILYQSEITGKTYDSEKALIEAEAKVSKEKKEEEARKKARAAAAKIVQSKLEEARKAQKEAQKALSDFCQEYGTFKTTLKENDYFSPFSLFDSLFEPFEF